MLPKERLFSGGEFSMCFNNTWNFDQISNMRFRLVAFRIDLFYAWKKYFDDVPDIEIIDGDILQQSGDAIVSPANSFGYMDGGLDLKYSQHFGWTLEKNVRKLLETCIKRAMVQLMMLSCHYLNGSIASTFAVDLQ